MPEKKFATDSEESNNLRREAYREIIYALLNQPSEQVVEILERRKDLLDSGLADEMEIIAIALEKRDELKAAEWLRSIAEIVNMPDIKNITPTPQSYFVFLQKLLSNYIDDFENLKIIFQGSIKKQKNVYGELHEILKEVANILPLIEISSAEYIAIQIGSFANRIFHFPFGSKKKNIEIAISSYETCLAIFSPTDFKDSWVTTQLNLGNAYQEREDGSKRENIEKAISTYKLALQFCTPETSSVEWAKLQKCLGTVYYRRIDGHKFQNLEQAVTHYQAALTVFTKEKHSYEWAATYVNLASTYADRVYTDSLEKSLMAIDACQNALDVFTQTKYPNEWATTHWILGTVYSLSILENTRDNSFKAISAYQAALQVHTCEEFPQYWARLQLSLGNAYSELKKDEEAILAYQAALQVYTFEEFPSEYSILQNNLGMKYHDKDYEKAIYAFQEALRVRTLEEFPLDWAMTQNNIASLYRSQGKINEAIKCWKAALEICKLHGDPTDWLTVGMTYGSQSWHWEKWSEAIEGLSLVVDSRELDRAWSNIDIRRQQIIADSILLYEMVITACIKDGQNKKAIEFVERSKTKGLVETLANKVYPNQNLFSSESYSAICQKLDQFRRDIKREQLKIEIAEIKNPSLPKRENGRFPPILPRERDYLKKLKHKFADFIKNEIQSIDNSFSLTQLVETISFEEIQKLLPDEKTAIIEWYVLTDSFLVFVITKFQSEPYIKQYKSSELKSLNNWFDNYLSDYSKPLKKNWGINLKSRLNELFNILNFQLILDYLDKTASFNQIIFIPHRFLHLLPLHALPLNNKSDSCLLEKFSKGVRYVPSSQTFKEILNYKRPDFQDFLAIQNPTKDLTYASLQVQSICQNFYAEYILVEEQATKFSLVNSINYLEKLKSSHCLHFACHGDFKEEFPLESYLRLAQNELLKLEDIFSLKLNRCRLVTLSACETGLTDHKSIGDEYIGLPSGFLYAGSPSVVSSLWKVDEVATAFLMIKFYEYLRQSPQQSEGSVAIALNNAQLWLRNMTCRTFFEEELPKYQTQIEQLFVMLPKGKRLIAQDSLRQVSKRKPCPFASPFYWAGFIAIGY